jgi:Spy/CpxP family protein refolding chaperone
MKKFLIIGGIVGVFLIALGVVGFAYAQTQTPQPGNYPGGWGMMGGNRHEMQGPGMMRGGRGMMGQGAQGPIHTYMIAALAEKLDLTVDQLQAKIEAGERPYDIAKAQNLNDEQIKELLEQAHDEALKAAVAAGVLTQEQADWMNQRMEQKWAGGFPGGAGGCPGMGGRWSNQS